MLAAAWFVLLLLLLLQEMDLATKQKADSWQSFVHGKGAKKKTGFMTSLKKESIFKTGENGKVGVTGSGKGMTDYHKRSRHEFEGDEGA